MTRPDLDTESYVPYSWREVCGFVKFPAIQCKEDAGDRAYGLSSLSKKLECLSIADGKAEATHSPRLF